MRVSIKKSHLANISKKLSYCGTGGLFFGSVGCLVFLNLIK